MHAMTKTLAPVRSSVPDVTELSALTASAVMTSPVLTVGAADLVTSVWNLMQRTHVGHVVVVAGDRCLGIVDVRDLWAAWAFDLERPARRSVVHLVTATPCVSCDTPLPLLCRALVGSRQGAVLVLDDAGELRGIVTSSDVVRALARVAV